MNPVEIVSKQFEIAGLNAQYKRRCKDGTLEDATAKELQILKTQAQIATIAQQLKYVTKVERTTWALEMKDHANALYSEGLITEAMAKYAEALAASDFAPITGNVDTLVIPVLCNLAACCIEIEEYGKGVRFCQQALDLRPQCWKAHMRKGVCFFHVGEFQKALVSLKRALNADAMYVVGSEVERKINKKDVDTEDEMRKCGGIKNLNIDSETENENLDDDRILRGDLGSHTDDPASTAHLHCPQEQEKQVARAHPQSAERERILSYMARATKSLAKQTLNEGHQRRAIQREFKSGRGLGDERARVGMKLKEAARLKAQGTSRAILSATPLSMGPLRRTLTFKGIMSNMYDFLILFYASISSLISYLLYPSVSRKKE